MAEGETQICPFLGKVCIASNCRMWNADMMDCIFWSFYNNLEFIGERMVRRED